MQKLPLLMVGWLFFMTPAAQAESQAEAARRANAANDFAECAAFAMVAAECLKSTPGTDSKTISEMESTSYRLIEISAALSNEKTALARIELSSRDMLQAIEKDCSNISRIIVTHGERCKPYAKAAKQ